MNLTRDQLISLLEGKLPDAEGARVIAELRALPESASFGLNAQGNISVTGDGIAIGDHNNIFVFKGEVQADFARILREAIEQHQPPPIRDRISIARLPDMLTNDLFGREKELQMLNDAWVNPQTNLICFTAFGGSGKSALVNRWLQEMAKENYRGAERIYAWSFWSQGSDQPQTSADPFIDAALRWFSDAEPTAGSPWDKGERLASLIKQSRTLLILDGLEPLQHPRQPMEGRLKEQSMQALLKELAGGQLGLCVISTREQIADLRGFAAPAVIAHDLEQLSAEAGASILRQQHLKGSDAELQQAAKEFGGHALALTILASFLHNAYDGDIRQRKEIGPLTEDELNGGHARRVMSSYETWLRDAGEHTLLAVLRLLGLFNRPADAAALAALRAEPAIPELTEVLLPLSEQQWKQTLAKLRRLKLLTDSSTNDELDAHPLLREHFRDQLQRAHPAAWQAGNLRLYEYLTSTAKDLPDTIEEMQPLFAAVTHGCEAGIHQEALLNVYWRRISRQGEFYSTRILGAFSADLSVLRCFFEEPWRQPVHGLNDVARMHILGLAAFNLRALGRLRDVPKPAMEMIKVASSLKSWQNLAMVTSNLSETYLTLGDLARALSFAQQSVKYADQDGDEYKRMVNRKVLADALYQAGRPKEAEATFCEAERIQTKLQAIGKFSYSAQEYRHCELLLNQGKYSEVIKRASSSLEIAIKNNWPLDIALDSLSLGQALFAQSRKDSTTDTVYAVELLRHAVDGLRQAGQQHHLPCALLARATWARMVQEYDRARRDLAEACSLAERGEMRLHLTDYHLESARLALALGEADKAREHWETAKAMVEEMGYHRRDKDLAEIAQQLQVVFL